MEWKTEEMDVMRIKSGKRKRKGKKENHSDVKTPQLPCGSSSKATNDSNKSPRFH